MYVDRLADTRVPGWFFEEGDFVVENNRHYESLFALGSGYMTVRSSIEEGFADRHMSPANFNTFSIAR